MAREVTEQERKMAQQYAQRALESGYVSPSQVENAVRNAYPAKQNNNDGSNGGAYGAYASAVARQEALLREQQALAEKQRKAALDATIKANNKAADKSLKEAYIANMMAKRNLPQQMKALGVSGGASETTLADIQNTYMNNRFGIEENRNEANAQARLAYDNGMAGDYSQFLSKQYDLQSTLASKAASAGSSSNKNDGYVNGYKIEGLGINVPGGTAASVVTGLRESLKRQGWSDSEIDKYLINNGIIG